MDESALNWLEDELNKRVERYRDDDTTTSSFPFHLSYNGMREIAAELAALRARCAALEEALRNLVMVDEWGVWVRSDGELAKQAAALLEQGEQ